jgi:hypothetical protein
MESAMPEPVDHEVKIRLKASQYLALRHLAAEEERPLSSLIRKVLADYIAQACANRVETERD